MFYWAPVVIVVAFTAISSFACRTIRCRCFAAGSYYHFGRFVWLIRYLIFLIITFTHLVSLRSLHSLICPPFLTHAQGFKGCFGKSACMGHGYRPESLDISDPVRQEFDLMPGPENDKKSEKLIPY